MARAAGQAEFEAVRGSFGPLETLAGAGSREDDVNEWSATFEGGPAVDAELSSPHNALGDVEGNVYIADKEAHAIRQVTTDGRIVTFVGVNQPGDDGDGPGDARAMHLDWPNGIWLSPAGTLYVLDLANAKVRRVSGGTMTTLFVAASLGGGRGLWVAEDESLAYASAGSALLRWTPAAGVTTFAGGFVDLGNLFVDAAGTVFVTDRDRAACFAFARTARSSRSRARARAGLSRTVRGRWRRRSKRCGGSGATRAAGSFWARTRAARCSISTLAASCTSSSTANATRTAATARPSRPPASRSARSGT